MRPGKIYWTFIGICFILISLWAGIFAQDRKREAASIALDDVVPPDMESHGEKKEENAGRSSELDLAETEQSDYEISGKDSAGKIQDLPPKVAITFDDGPHPRYTEMLLDGLKERNVRATFFLIGENILGNEDIVKRMADDGHLIGNHTYSHVKVTGLSPEKACEEITKTSALVREITKKDTEYIRPPFGEWDKSLECGIELFPVLWTVDTRDWTTCNVSDVVRRGTTGVKDGDVILLHDCYESSVKAALQIVDDLQNEGFEFVTVDEMILE